MNVINIGFANNVDLASSLADIGVGQTGKAEVSFRVISKDDMGMQAEVVSFVPEGYEVGGGESQQMVADTSLPSPAATLP